VRRDLLNLLKSCRPAERASHRSPTGGLAWWEGRSAPRLPQPDEVLSPRGAGLPQMQQVTSFKSQVTRKA
jgi:hypothetical protein